MRHKLILANKRSQVLYISLDKKIIQYKLVDRNLLNKNETKKIISAENIDMLCNKISTEYNKIKTIIYNVYDFLSLDYDVNINKLIFFLMEHNQLVIEPKLGMLILEISLSIYDLRMIELLLKEQIYKNSVYSFLTRDKLIWNECDHDTNIINILETLNNNDVDITYDELCMVLLKIKSTTGISYLLSKGLDIKIIYRRYTHDIIKYLSHCYSMLKLFIENGFDINVCIQELVDHVLDTCNKTDLSLMFKLIFKFYNKQKYIYVSIEHLHNFIIRNYLDLIELLNGNVIFTYDNLSPQNDKIAAILNDTIDYKKLYFSLINNKD